MKRLFALTLGAVLSVSLLTGCGAGSTSSTASGSSTSAGTVGSGEKQLSVVASFYPMYDFAKKIGGDHVTVTDLVPAGTEPHDWEPSPSDVITLEKADVFVYSGAGMEPWVTSVLNTLENKNLVTVEASDGITLRHGFHEEEETAASSSAAASGSAQAADADVDPHVWLAPLNAKIEMENIKNAFVQADPDHKADYEANYTKWSAECDTLDQEFKTTLSGLPNKDIVVAHEAFGYLCDAYGLNQVGIEGINPDSEPDPARMAEIQDFVKANNVKTIFSEELVSPKVAQSIADATGAKMETLNPLEGLTDEQLANGEDYFSVMRQNLQVLKEALE